MSVAVVAVLGILILVGASVQSLIGLGMGLVAAPIITLIAPELMPGVLLWLSTFLPAIHLITQREQVRWRELAWALPARIPGTAIGAWLVVMFSAAQLGIFVALVVLLAVVLTWRAVVVPINRGTLIGAGLLGGVTGTASSIGGPPFALLLQREPPQDIRDTMAVFFVAGSAFSLIGLAIGGQLDANQLWLALMLVPVLFGGLTLGRAVGRRVDASSVRPAILAVCAASSVVLLVRSIAG